ncbi:MAG: hypothetical protein IRZ08_09030 [Frankia sp.]|nr:hypothetical protein [Frankia sp.]
MISIPPKERLGDSRRWQLARTTARPSGWHDLILRLDRSTLFFGSVNPRLVEADFSPEQRRDFTIRKQILWESETATDREVSRVEVEYIRRLRANDPAVGYNQWPRLRAAPVPGPLAITASPT